MEGVFIQDALFDEVDLSNINFSEGHMQRVGLNGANFSGADLRDSRMLLCRMRDARFNNTKMSGVDFQGGDFSGAELIECDLSDGSLRECALDGCRFIKCDISGNDLRKTTLTKAEFDSCVTEGAIFYGKAPWDGSQTETDLRKEMRVFDGE